MSDLRQLCDAAIHETDQARLEKLVYEIEQALFERGQADELDDKERTELERASRVLLMLKTERLSWRKPGQ
jgi:hypothetical protein